MIGTWLAGALLVGAMAVTAAAPVGSAAPAAAPAAREVVLVHGAVMEGSAWRGVYDRLVAKGYRVVVAQMPLTGLDADVAAVRQALAQTTGPVVLVAHSYGGAVISVVGDDPRVRSLVYVAAHQPDKGESVAGMNARYPLPAHVKEVGKGVIIVDPEHFRADVAADVPEREVAFLARSQRPTAFAAFTDTLPAAAWHDKPNWAVVARQDRTISPDLERFYYARSKAHVTELDGSHLVFVSHADAVARVIEQAAGAE